MSRRSRGALIGAVCVVAVGAACRTAQPPVQKSAPVPTGWHSSPVPMPPPDSEPQWLYDDSSWTTDSVHWTGTFVRDVVLLRFAVGATQQERQAAVDAVQGTVVGGKPFEWTANDGVYLIRLPRDPTKERFFSAIGALRKMPQVLWVMPNRIVIGTGG